MRFDAGRSVSLGRGLSHQVLDSSIGQFIEGGRVRISTGLSLSSLTISLIHMNYQLYPQPAADRYTFDTTVNSLISIFVVLTNQILSEVVNQAVMPENEDEEATPREVAKSAIFFSVILIIGHHILLNLVLAVFLKAFSGHKDHEEQVMEINEKEPAQIPFSPKVQPLDGSQNFQLQTDAPVKIELEMISGMKISQPEDLLLKDSQFEGGISEECEYPNSEQKQIANDESPSLFLFSPDNWLRAKFKTLIENAYFDGFISFMIALYSILLALNHPKNTDDKDEAEPETPQLLLTILSAVFVLDLVIKAIAMGFIVGSKAYLKDPWNVFDFTVVILSTLTLDVFDISSKKGFLALRALQPLRLMSRNDSLKMVVTSLLKCLPLFLRLLFLFLLFLLAFSIFGVYLLKDQLGYCIVDGYYTIWFGQYDRDRFELCMEDNGEWLFPLFSYNHVFSSMLTFFAISTLDLWPDFMFDIIETRKFYSKKSIISLFYIVYIVAMVFLMKLFISVIACRFNEETKKQKGTFNFTDEQKEWVSIQSHLARAKPKIIPEEPNNAIRLWCFKIVQSQAFEYTIMVAIAANTMVQCFYHYDIDDSSESLLENVNFFFVGIFTLEMVLKVSALTLSSYWRINWNKFDCILVVVSLLDLNTGFLRIIRIFRLLRYVKTSGGLRTLLMTLDLLKSEVLAATSFTMLILFIFTVVAMALFDPLENYSRYEKLNFDTFSGSLVMLLANNWTHVILYCYHKTDDDTNWVAIPFWLLFKLLFPTIFVGVFIGTIYETFNDIQAFENDTHHFRLKKKDITDFQDTWAKFNPSGEHYMDKLRLPDFLRELPPPLGFQGIQIEEAELNKVIFLLNIKDHRGKVCYPEVMWTIFHSIVGINDDKVNNCKSVANHLKTLKSNYKDLGEEVTLDSLCGNMISPSEASALKQIKATEALTKLISQRAFNKMKSHLRQQEMPYTANVQPQPSERAEEPQMKIDFLQHPVTQGEEESLNKTQNPRPGRMDRTRQ